MVGWKYLLPAGSIALFFTAGAVLFGDSYRKFKYRRNRSLGLEGVTMPEAPGWHMTAALTVLAWAPMLIALSALALIS